MSMQQILAQALGLPDMETEHSIESLIESTGEGARILLLPLAGSDVYIVKGGVYVFESEDNFSTSKASGLLILLTHDVDSEYHTERTLEVLASLKDISGNTEAIEKINPVLAGGALTVLEMTAEELTEANEALHEKMEAGGHSNLEVILMGSDDESREQHTLH